MERKLEYEKELKIIKNYISLQPGQPKYRVSAFTGVPVEIIRKLIELGFLEEEEGILVIAKRKSINAQKRAQLIAQLSAMKNENDYEKEKSVLIRDLEEIKKTRAENNLQKTREGFDR